MLNLCAYRVGPGGPPNPAERLVLDPAGRAVGVVREEPWPELFTRPWPDGAAGRPWLMRLLGWGASDRAVRLVVRDRADDRPVLRLHWRQPLFRQTVGIFDADDRRIGYVAAAWKGAGPVWTVRDVTHSPFVTLRRGADGSQVVTAADGTPVAHLRESNGTVEVADVPLLPGPLDSRLAVLALALAVAAERGPVQQGKPC